MLSPKAVLFILSGVVFVVLGKVEYEGGHTIKSTQSMYVRCYPTTNWTTVQVVLQMSDINKNLIVESKIMVSKSQWTMRLESEESKTANAPFKELPKTVPDGLNAVLLILAEDDGQWTTGGVADLQVYVKARKNATDVRRFRVSTFGDVQSCDDPFSKCEEL